jgi:hypothetical protein
MYKYLNMGFNYKKITKAAGKRYGVKYTKKRGLTAKSSSAGKIIKDIAWIKSRLNVEKKFVNAVETLDGDIGQVSTNASGYFATSIMSQIPQGDGESQRNGNSLKATGLVVKMNFITQFNCAGTRRVKVMVVRTLDPGLSPTEVTDKLLDINPLTGQRDYNSELDYTQLKDGRIKVISTKYIYLKETGVLGGAATRTTAVCNMPIKLNDVWRYDVNASTKPENINYHLIAVADNGNSGTSDSTILGIFVPQNNSGVTMKAHSRFWYVDN